MSDVIEYRLEGGVAVLVFDDGKANVLNDESIAALHIALDRAEKEAGSVALVGRPGRFSAGFDLSIMGTNVDAMRALVRRELSFFCGSGSSPVLFSRSVPVMRLPAEPCCC